MSKCPIYISLVEALAILNSREVIDVDLIAEAQRVIDVRVRQLGARVSEFKTGNKEDSSEEPRESTTMRFKVGDVCKIADRTHGHGFDMNSIVTITAIIDSENGYIALSNGTSWSVVDEELELVLGLTNY